MGFDSRSEFSLLDGTQGLDDTTLTAEAMYPINFTQPNKRFVEATASYLLLLQNSINLKLKNLK